MTPLRKYKFRHLAPLSVAVALFMNFACTQKESAKDRLGTVKRDDLVQRVSATGTGRGKRQSYIFASYSGFVSKLFVKLGQKVNERAPLVSIAQTMDQTASSIFPIRAPFSGTVTQILKTEGEAVESSASNIDHAILRLVDLSEYWIDVDVPEIDVAKISLGQSVTIKANALSTKSYNGVVREIALSSKASQDRWDRGKVVFPVKIQVSDPDEELLSGMSIVVDIVTAKAENALVLPHEYIHRDPQGFFVLNSKDERIPIKVGLSNELIVQVLEGVTENTQVKMVDFSKIGTAPTRGGSQRGRSR